MKEYCNKEELSKTIIKKFFSIKNLGKAAMFFNWKQMFRSSLYALSFRLLGIYLFLSPTHVPTHSRTQANTNKHIRALSLSLSGLTTLIDLWLIFLWQPRLCFCVFPMQEQQLHQTLFSALEFQSNILELEERWE